MCLVIFLARPFIDLVSDLVNKVRMDNIFLCFNNDNRSSFFKNVKNTT